MIPSFNLFVGKYVRSVFPYLVIPSALLSSGLIRNVVNISVIQLMIGLGAVGIAIVTSLLRDERGFWFYAIQSRKVAMPMVSVSADGMVIKKSFTRNSQSLWAKLFHQPVYAAILTASFVSIVCLLLFPLFREHTDALIYLFGIAILPLFLCWLLWQSLHYRWHAVLSFDKKQQQKRSITYFLLCDLFTSLMVNFSLVLPIEHKPAFSLALGYINPAFIIAFIILMLCVVVFILFFAIRSRRYSMVGELLCGDIGHDFARGLPRWLAWFLHHLWRFPIYIGFTILWSIGVCFFFSILNITPRFLPLYFTAMVPIVGIYLLERYQVVFDSFLDAQEMHYRLVNGEMLAKQ